MLALLCFLLSLFALAFPLGKSLFGVELLLVLFLLLTPLFALFSFWAKLPEGGAWSLGLRLRSFSRLFFAVKMKLLYVQKCVRVCDENLKMRGVEKFVSFVLLSKNEHNRKFLVLRFSLFIIHF